MSTQNTTGLKPLEDGQVEDTENKSIDDHFKKNILSEADLLNQKLQVNQGLFKLKTANKWLEQAKIRPIPKKIFGPLWFEGELGILFADTNLGKSIIAVQICDSISRGHPSCMGFRLEASKQLVIYLDFELSDKQFENRYSNNFDQHYSFDENFLRVEINPDADTPDKVSFEDYLSYSLEQTVVNTGAKVIVIDNITYLKHETEKSKDALPLMKHLKALKTKYGLSILILAHTPKRDLSKPITRNDLAGSKMLINFADSCFAIGESQSDKQFRYIKQIKARNTEMIYDSENVVVCRIDKPHNFLLFELVEYGTESEHLKQITDKDRENLEKNIIELKTTNPSISLGAIAKQLRTNKMKVKRTLDKA